MPKPQDIFQLAQQEAVRVTASPQAWRSFLYTAAHNYHTTYLNQLLIHAQRPDAAACASMEYWNTKANRLVMRGSRSITVLQRRQGVAVTKPVFAIGDTTLLSQTHTGGPWEVTDTTRPLLLQGKPDDWLSALAQDGISTEADRARRMMERNVADSTLQWAQPDEQMQLLQALVTQSAVYIARLRIGLPVRDEDYPALQSVSQFDTCQISLCLGGYLQAAAEPMLNAIGREALRLNRDSIAIPHEPVHNESTPTQLNSREEAVTHDVHEEPRRLPDSEPFPAEPAEPNLGIVSYHGGKSFVMADIPGIIEGASQGKGLGLRFLRHIERNSLLLFMVPADSDDIRKEYEVLLNELRTFNPEMLDKQRVLAVTKSDMLDQELMDEIEPTLPEGIPHVFISSVSGLGISVLKDILWEELNKESNKIEDIVHRPKDVTRLQQELKDMGEDEDIVYEYEEDVDDDDDIDYEYEEEDWEEK